MRKPWPCCIATSNQKQLFWKQPLLQCISVIPHINKHLCENNLSSFHSWQPESISARLLLLIKRIIFQTLPDRCITLSIHQSNACISIINKMQTCAVHLMIRHLLTSFQVFLAAFFHGPEQLDFPYPFATV